jgi:hypothetical protein
MLEMLLSGTSAGDPDGAVMPDKCQADWDREIPPFRHSGTRVDPN